MVCAAPADEKISVIPTPVPLSIRIFSTVSLVTLFLLSLTSTLPIKLDAAKHFVALDQKQDYLY